MRPYIFKNDRAEFPHGYLEWKPEVEEPDPIHHEKFAYQRHSEGKTWYDHFMEEWESDQQAIERSRVAVSEGFRDYANAFLCQNATYDFYEGKDFTIRDGKAYPVVEAGKDMEVECLIETIEKKEDEIEFWQKELSRLRAENEALKKGFDELITEFEYYGKEELSGKSAAGSVKDVLSKALETLK